MGEEICQHRAMSKRLKDDHNSRTTWKPTVTCRHTSFLHGHARISGIACKLAHIFGPSSTTHLGASELQVRQCMHIVSTLHRDTDVTTLKAMLLRRSGKQQQRYMWLLQSRTHSCKIHNLVFKQKILEAMCMCIYIYVIISSSVDKVE